jgi:hypothetical protein
MGMISHLGPIDPQIGGLPALALSNALDVIAELTSRYPAASEMLTRYLIDQAPMQVLGYYERVTESAAQYAERLLRGKQLADGTTAEEAAKHLVNHYKDHGFVIDSDEARSVLGSMIQESTEEYDFGDEIYRLFERLVRFAQIHDKSLWVIGAIDDERALGLRRRRKPAAA